MTMVRIERILCPVDFSEFSRHAVDYAIAIGSWYNAAVTALHVVPPVIPIPYTERVVYPPPLVRTEGELEQLRLQLAMFLVQEADDFKIERVVTEGYVAGEILRRATSMPADLVVMGTHGRSGFERMILGSVTETVLRHSKSPVLTVPPKAPDAVPVGPRLFTRILCAIDFSLCSLMALDYASSMAQQSGAQLSLLHVVEPIADYVTATVGDTDAKSLQVAAQRHLHDVAGEHIGSRVAAATEILAVGKPGQQILRTADEQHIDLIVLGVAGRSAVDVVFFGSTTNYVVRRARCPVLTLSRG